MTTEGYPAYDLDALVRLARAALEARGEPVNDLSVYKEIAHQRRLQLQSMLDACPDAEIVSAPQVELFIEEDPSE